MKKLLATMLALTMLCTMLVGCQDKKGSKKSKDKDKDSISSSDVINDSDEDDSSENEVSDTEFTPGYRTVKEYINESLGLKFTLGDNMAMASDDEIKNLMQIGVDIIFEDTELGKKIKDISEISTVYDMMAVDITNNSNVMIMAEKPMISSITVPQYIEALKKQLDSVGMASDFQDVHEQKLCGITFSNLTYSMSYNGVEMTQTMLIKKVGDRMVAISLTSTKPGMLDEMLDCFSRI